MRAQSGMQPVSCSSRAIGTPEDLPSLARVRDCLRTDRFHRMQITTTFQIQRRETDFQTKKNAFLRLTNGPFPPLPNFVFVCTALLHHQLPCCYLLARSALLAFITHSTCSLPYPALGDIYCIIVSFNTSCLSGVSRCYFLAMLVSNDVRGYYCTY
jgi:hypothetical protein